MIKALAIYHTFAVNINSMMPKSTTRIVKGLTLESVNKMVETERDLIEQAMQLTYGKTGKMIKTVLHQVVISQ